ncbi:MAG: hypothetical protein K6C32_01730, partial [Bacilli bacterium]|nr:hypothetical protein [Bacilli bacterium]
MNSVWSLPASTRIIIFAFTMVSLAFLLFSIAYVFISKRNRYIVAYLISLFVVILVNAIIKTPLIYGLNDAFCDYLTLINIVPIVLSIFVYLKNKSWLVFIDDVYLLINISLFGFIPYYGYIVGAATGYLVIRCIIIFFKAYKESKEYPGSMAIKYALDELNEGVIFSNAFHQIIYINKAMINLLSELDINSYEKINVIYKQLLYKASRKISEHDIVIEINNVPYRFMISNDLGQVTAFDVSKEESLLKQEELNKETLSKLNENLKEQLLNVDKIQKEKELLNVKGYIHDSLAQKLSILHMTLLMDKSSDLTEIKKLLLDLDISKDLKQDDLSYLKDLLNDIGVTLTIEGELPKDKSTASLFIKTIKECSTNAIRHGNAKNINVIISDNALQISNDGFIPDKVIFGNGLSSIKIEAEQLGYILIVSLENNVKINLKP